MFGGRYFGGRYFAARYFGKRGAAAAVRPTRQRLVKEPVWLLEFQAYLTADVTLDTGVRSAGLNTFYFAGPGGITTRADDTPASTVYEPRLMQDLGIVVRSAFGDDNANTGKPPVNGGFFRIANADGKFDFLRTSGVGGRPFYLKRLADRADPVSTAETVFIGNCRGWASDEITRSLMLRVRDKLEALETQFLSDTYGGTVSGSSASIDGTASMAGKLKPYALGRNYQVEGLPVNPFDRIYQGAKNAQNVINVSDGGLGLTNDGDYASIALLRAATIAAGHYATCLAQASWRLGGDPAKVVHAELRSHSLSAPEMSAGLVAEAVLLASGIASGDIDHASFAALSLTGSTVWQVGLYVDDNRSTLDIVCEVLNSLGATITATPLGKIKCCPIGMPYQSFSDYGAAQPNAADSVRTFTFRDAAKGSSFQLKPSPAAEGDGVRAKYVSIRALKRHRVLSATEVNSSASADTRFLVQREFLDLTQTSFLSPVTTIEPNGAWLKFDTLLSDATGAIFEGVRRATFYGESRDRITMSMPRSSAKRDSDGSDIDLGDTVTVQIDRPGFESGRPAYVTKRTDNYGADTAILELLG